MGHSNQMGMVKSREIGQPACLPPKSALAAHGGASETERISADDDDLASLNRHKVQSNMFGNKQNTDLSSHKIRTSSFPKLSI